jgi:3-carboxy-cis,cis-muconate cycloisomerase
MAEHVVMLLGERVDRVMARALVDGAVAKATSTGRPFKDVLQEDQAITTVLKPDELVVALDPAGYLGVAGLLIDRALAAYQAQHTREIPRPFKGEG